MSDVVVDCEWSGPRARATFRVMLSFGLPLELYLVLGSECRDSARLKYSVTVKYG